MNNFYWGMASCAWLCATGSVEAAGFVEDSHASVSSRSYYINHDNRLDTGLPGSTHNLSQAFTLNFNSGFTQGWVGFGLDVQAMSAFKLDEDVGYGGAPSRYNTGPSSVFPTGKNGESADQFGDLGVTAKARISKTELRVGELMPNLPVVVYNDGRLLPQTFQGTQITSKDLDRFTFTAGRLNSTRERNSSSNDPFAIAGANSATGPRSNAFYYGGGEFQATKSLKLSYYYGQLDDFYKQHFVGLSQGWLMGPGRMVLDLGYYRSTSDGKNNNESAYYSTGWYGDRVTRGEVDNSLYSAMATYHVKGLSVGVGRQISRGDSDFPFLNEGNGSSTALNSNTAVLKFTRAEEESWILRSRYDFAGLGVPGLTLAGAYVHGDNAQSVNGEIREWERDVQLAYTVQGGPLKDVAFIYRNNKIRGPSQLDINIISVNYTLALF